MVIYSRNKFRGIHSIAYLAMAEDRINYLNVSNQRAITTLLTLCLLVRSVGNIFIHFGPRIDLTCADPGSFVRKGGAKLTLRSCNRISKLLESVEHGLFNMQKVSEVNYIFFSHTLC